MVTSFTSSLKRAFLSARYVISITGIILMCFVSAKDYLKDSGADAAYIIDLLINLSLFKKTIVFFSALPFVTVYCQDYKSKYINSIIVRSGKSSYIITNIISCALTSFSSVFAGMLIFSCIISYKFPINAESEYLYCDTVISSSVIYILIVISIFSLYCTVWAAAGLAFSSILPDKYAALGSPLIFGYLLEEITFHFPSFINLYKLSHCVRIISGSYITNYIYTIAVFLVLIVSSGIIFSHFAKRRMKNELV